MLTLNLSDFEEEKLIVPLKYYSIYGHDSVLALFIRSTFVIFLESTSIIALAGNKLVQSCDAITVDQEGC